MGTRLQMGAVGALVLTLGWGCARTEATGAAVPTVEACRVALAPAGGEDDDAEIVRLQQEARVGVDSRHALEQLGYRFVARARQTHDDGDYTLAAGAADCLASRYPDALSAQLLKGHVLHQQHRFAEAERIARRLTAAREFVLDFGLLGDALMDQGRLSEAAEAYQKMIDLKPYYQSYTRAAHLRWLKGDLEGAIELTGLAIQSASPRDPESVAWAYTRLAAFELQRRRFTQAASAIESALTYQPEYAAALLTRGRLLLAEQRADEAVTPLQRAAERNPLPEYRWALADALRLVGRLDEAVRVERALVADGGADPRTLALYLATRRTAVADALAAVERELQQRSDVFTLDALAWALAAAGRLDEANAAMTRALATGTEDGRLFLHAAVIADRRGDITQARRWATRAGPLAATLLPSEAAELDRVRLRVAGPRN